MTFCLISGSSVFELVFFNDENKTFSHKEASRLGENSIKVNINI